MEFQTYDSGAMRLLEVSQRVNIKQRSVDVDLTVQILENFRKTNAELAESNNVTSVLVAANICATEHSYAAIDREKVENVLCRIIGPKRAAKLRPYLG